MKHPGPDSLPGDTAVQLAEYVCGLLRPEEHAQVHLLLSRDDQALAVALAWEERLLALVDALPRAQPDPALRERLQRTLGIGPAPAFQPPPQPQLLRRESVEPASAPEAKAPATAPAASAPTAPEDGTAAPIAAPDAVRPAATEPRPRAGTAGGHDSERNHGQAHKPPASRPQRQTRSPDPSHSPEPIRTQLRESAAAPKAAQAAPSRPAGDHHEERHRALLRKLWFWRLVGLCATVAAVVAFMLPGEPPPPPVQVVKVAPTRAAILQAPGTSSTPGWTATLDPQGNLMMQPLVPTEVPAGHQALLWTRSAAIPDARLLGRIDPNRAVQVPSAQLGALADDQLLEITLENDGDAAQGLPNGPVLFIGQMTVFGSETAAVPESGTTDGGELAAGGAIQARP